MKLEPSGALRTARHVAPLAGAWIETSALRMSRR